MVRHPPPEITPARFEAFVADELLRSAGPEVDDLVVTLHDKEPHTFELDPLADSGTEPALERMTRLYGLPPERARANEAQLAAAAAADGLPYTSGRSMSSSRDPLRLVHLANEYGVGWRFVRAVQDEIFTGNTDAFDHATLSRLGTGFGIPADLISSTLAGDGYADRLLADREQARRLGARGVPFVVFGGEVVMQGGSTTSDYLGAIERAMRVLGAEGSSAHGPTIVDGVQCLAREPEVVADSIQRGPRT
ncbi:Predicted dithiol-disulfide isomerase, DsbA family [Micromonospora carbonacea]|uniref:Predicted dithiol-disulfide isomerase, DsbA family n=1 Tax=Micromonospora carbonacea TaxID=47853 RepID=A0A1C4WVH7_9ACTN|nr:Predicted dithiol-disulfide isomerase, DsbA family [Micromonospora carbonacea]